MPFLMSHDGEASREVCIHATNQVLTSPSGLEVCLSHCNTLAGGWKHRVKSAVGGASAEDFHFCVKDECWYLNMINRLDLHCHILDVEALK